jgi:tetratricopeptide (TPR) repeat protein
MAKAQKNPASVAVPDHQRNMPPRRFVAASLGPVGAAVLAVIAYANSLGNGFAYDDDTIILRNPVVQEEYQGQAVPWYEPWRRPYWPETNRRQGGDVLYRPLAVQTYAWDMRLLGPNPRWFHLVNVVLHAAVSVGAWWLARRLCGSDAASLVAAWVFAVHPIHTEAVTSIVGRAEVLAAGGIVAVLVALEWTVRAKRRGAVVLWSVAGIAAAAAAIFSKESGVAVVPISVAFAWWLARSGRERGTDGIRPSGTGDARSSGIWRRAAPMLAGMVLIFGVYLQMRYAVCGGRLRITGQIGGTGNILRETRGLPLVLTPVSLVGRYVALMAWPGRLLADYSYAVVVPTRSPMEPYFVIGLATLALMLLAAIRSARPEGSDRRSMDRPAAGAAIGPVRAGGAVLVGVAGWFFSYVLVSNSIVLIGVIMAERWFYGPSLWMTVLGVMGGQYMLSRYAGRTRFETRGIRSVSRVAFAAVLVALCGRTWVRNRDWRDTTSLMEHDLRVMSPGRRSAFFASSLAATRLREGRLAEAERLAREAVGIYPENAAIQCTLAEVLLAEKRPAEALQVAIEAQRILPSDTQVAAVVEQARSAVEGVDLEANLRSAEERIRQNPNDAAAYVAAGETLERLGRYEQAAERFRQAVERDAGNEAAWLGWARTLAASNRFEEAAGVYEQILRRWPDSWEAHANLALQLMDKVRGSLYQPERAIRHAEEALRLAPAEMRTQLTLNLAEVCASCGRTDRAIRLFEQVARGLAPNDPQRRRLNDRIEFLRKRG